MKALVFEDIGSIKLKEVADPKIENQNDAIIHLTLSAICGTDLHMIRGTMPGVKSGTILGHEGVGIVEAIGSNVTKFKIGDRVIVPSTIGCGTCRFCKQKDYSQCDNANPYGKDSGTVFFGSPASNTGLPGMQAQKVRVPYADVNLIKIPDELLDEQVILLSDILPTAYMAVENAQTQPGDTVAVFGVGPVGQLVIAVLKILGITDIFAIDRIPSRLKMAADQGAIAINFDKVDPVIEIKRLTNGDGPTKIIDAVGIDAQMPAQGIMGMFRNSALKKQFHQEVKEVAPNTNIQNGNWIPGDAPSQVFEWAADLIAKNGIISLIGVYTQLLRFFPMGKIFGKNVIVAMGNCNHYKYIPMLLEWVKEGKFDSEVFITQQIKLDDIEAAYKKFDKREDGWIKVVIKNN